MVGGCLGDRITLGRWDCTATHGQLQNIRPVLTFGAVHFLQHDFLLRQYTSGNSSWVT
jgi:hypothetical protein